MLVLACESLWSGEHGTFLSKTRVWCRNWEQEFAKDNLGCLWGYAQRAVRDEVGLWVAFLGEGNSVSWIVNSACAIRLLKKLSPSYAWVSIEPRQTGIYISMRFLPPLFLLHWTWTIKLLLSVILRAHLGTCWKTRHSSCMDHGTLHLGQRLSRTVSEHQMLRRQCLGITIVCSTAGRGACRGQEDR